MKRIFIFILASNLSMNALFSAQTGKTGLVFLKLGVDARALGLGETYTAFTNTPAGTYYNPASISNTSDLQLLIMHKEWIQDTKVEFISAITSFKNLSFGLSINSTRMENIEIRTKPGPPIGTFDAQNAAVGLTTSYNLDSKFYFGLTTKILYEKIYVDEATGYSFDFGGIYSTTWGTNIGLSIKNVGKMNKLENEVTNIPTSIRLGGVHKIYLMNNDAALSLASDVVSFTKEKETHLHLGTEFAYRNTIAVRFGYQTGYESRNFSAGIGFEYKMFRLDYAFIPFRYDFGSTHTFSLGILFD